MKQAFALSLMILMIGCKEPVNQHGRIWVGMGIAEGCTSASWNTKVPLVKDSKIAGLMLDLTLDPSKPGPAAGYQYYLPHPLDSVVRQLKQENIAYGIRIIWKQDSTPMTAKRLNNWFTDLSGLLLRTNKYPPEWIMFQGEWINRSWREGALRGFMGMMRTSWTEFEGDIWLTGTGPSPIFSGERKEATAQGWVNLVEGFTDASSVSALRSSTGDQTNAATTSMRILSIAPAWSGYYWRIEQWLTKGEGLVSVSDLFLSGEACGLSISAGDLNRIQAFLSVN